MLRPPDHLSSERLLVRRLRPQDAEAIFQRYAQDAEVTRYLSWRPHRRIEETHAFIADAMERAASGRNQSYALTRTDAGLIGSIAFHRKSDSPSTLSVGYVLARAWWGQGYVSEALAKLVSWALVQPAIHRAEAHCHHLNGASARVMEKAGMQREALLRRYTVFPNVSDVPQDAILCAAVRR